MAQRVLRASDLRSISGRDSSTHPQRVLRARITEPHRTWTDLSDDALLDTRLCDLELWIAGTRLERRIAGLYAELEERGLDVRPHCWLSDEWFSPEGVPGIAVPFYLAHPRLRRLEERQMCEVEGGTDEWCRRLLRHEAGHALEVAFRLRRRRDWQRVFGRGTVPYPREYIPRPHSRDYVLHLDWWYAQSHPSEDFAETFAVWLRPGRSWKRRYRHWPALRKLEYVDELMKSLRGARPCTISHEVVDPLHELDKTLREHYEYKRTHYLARSPESFDRDLLRLFGRTPSPGRPHTAAAFLRRHASVLRRQVVVGGGHHPYAVDQVLREMIVRCRELRLYLRRPGEDTRRRAVALLRAQTGRTLRGRPRTIQV